MSEMFNHYKHRRFMALYEELINEAETREKKQRIFTILDYINHLHQRITALEEKSQLSSNSDKWLVAVDTQYYPRVEEFNTYEEAKKEYDRLDTFLRDVFLCKILEVKRGEWV